MKISVCMAIHNGELFLREQIDSIISQLQAEDELIISDDNSTDDSLAIVKSYHDDRIRVLPSQHFGNPSKNFEYALRHCQNEIIFLSDQDDVWHAQKISSMMKELNDFDLVVCNCRLIDQKGKILIESFFDWNHSQPGLLKNIYRNSFIGCCIAFRKIMLDKILPFPQKISIYDQWIGMVALRHFKVKFIPEILVDHRRHANNYSTTGAQSKNSWNKKVISRLQLVKLIWQH